MTNGEMIRSMSDEKMANIMSEMILGALAGLTNDKTLLETLEAGVLDILKQEVPNEETE